MKTPDINTSVLCKNPSVVGLVFFVFVFFPFRKQGAREMAQWKALVVQARELEFNPQHHIRGQRGSSIHVPEVSV